MHLKVFVKLKKTLKTLSSGQKNPKKSKKPKKPKKTHWAGFFKKNPGFFQPCPFRFRSIPFLGSVPLKRILKRIRQILHFLQTSKSNAHKSAQNTNKTYSINMFLIFFKKSNSLYPNSHITAANIRLRCDSHEVKYRATFFYITK
jgi:hypothetical protein